MAPSFVKPSGVSTPFGPREYLRSTNPKPQYESYTVAASTVPERTIDGSPQRILQRGLAMAKITSGPEAGNVGPFQADATDGRQTLANLVGLNETFLPWQLLSGDNREIAVATNCTAVQAWCRELDADGEEIVLTDTTADALRGTKRLDINFA